MKTLLIAFFICLCAGYAVSQSATTMQDILESVNAKVSELEDEKNQEVVNITLDLLVREGKKTMYRYLDPSFEYTAVAIGDRRISKLKIEVYKKGPSDWEYVSEMSGSSPVLKFKPAAFEQYEFTVGVDEFKSENTTGHFALLLYHRNPEIR
jgi:hypothetical protein